MAIPVPVKRKPSLSTLVKRQARKEAVSLNSRIQADIKKLVKLSTFEPDQQYWLDTKSPELNETLGSREYGIPYGRLIELRGKNHGGKTTLALILSAMAQQDGAGVGLIDVEQSRDRDWAEKFGTVWRDVVKIYPKLIKRKNKPPRLEAAEELFAEAEAAMAAMAAMGIKKQFWFLDSIAMLRTRRAILGNKKEEKSGAIRSRGMNLDRAVFLSERLPEWTGLAASYNATIILINQMRTNPTIQFGSKAYSPGEML